MNLVLIRLLALVLLFSIVTFVSLLGYFFFYHIRKFRRHTLLDIEKGMVYVCAHCHSQNIARYEHNYWSPFPCYQCMSCLRPIRIPGTTWFYLVCIILGLGIDAMHGLVMLEGNFSLEWFLIGIFAPGYCLVQLRHKPPIKIAVNGMIQEQSVSTPRT